MNFIFSFLAEKLGLSKAVSLLVFWGGLFLLCLTGWGIHSCRSSINLRRYKNEVIKQEKENAVKDERAVKRNIRSLENTMRKNRRIRKTRRKNSKEVRKTTQKSGTKKSQKEREETSEEKQKTRQETIQDYYRDLDDLVK